MIKINLIPAEVLARQKQQYRMAQAVALGGLAVVLIVGASFFHLHRARSLEAVLKHRQDKLAQLQTIVAKVQEVDAAARLVRARLDVVNGLLGGRLLNTKFLQDLLRSLPGGIWFTNLSANPSASDTLNMQISARARSSEDLAEWIRTLDNSGTFSNVDLGAVTAVDEAGARLLNFSVSSAYRMPR